MPSDAAADARVLLDVAPDQYVAERDRLVKQARGALQRNPFAGLAIAAGIGFLVGLTSRSR